MLDADWKKDQRLVVQLKDLLTNVTMGNKAVTNGDATVTSSDNDAIYVTMVAKELGYARLTHGQDCKIGRELPREARQGAPHLQAPRQCTWQKFMNCTSAEGGPCFPQESLVIGAPASCRPGSR